MTKRNQVLRSKPAAMRLRLSGHSMHPTIQHGQTITTIKVPFRSLNVDDIIVFEHSLTQELVAHRITAINHKKMIAITKGDNNRWSDRYYRKPNDIYGLVILIGTQRV